MALHDVCQYAYKTHGPQYPPDDSSIGAQQKGAAQYPLPQSSEQGADFFPITFALKAIGSSILFYLDCLRSEMSNPLSSFTPLKPSPGGPKAWTLAVVEEQASSKAAPSVVGEQTSRSFTFAPGCRLYKCHLSLRCLAEN